MVRRIITSFRDMPIRQKLMLLILVSTSAALLLAGLGIVLSDSALFRRYLERDLATLATMVSDSSTASVAFDDPDSARELLSTLQARKYIVAACLLRADGTILGQYLRPGSAGCPVTLESRLRDEDSVTVVQPVILQGRSIGRLIIQYRLDEIAERMRLFGLAVLLVLTATSLIVVPLSARLRTVFAEPILELARTATRVSQTRDYGVRAPKLSNDEVGDLVSAFNEMLAGIQSRDAELRNSLSEREQVLSRLAELNRELKRSNEELARSNEDLERFAFLASHDLQEPLRMITLYSQMLVKEAAGAGGPLPEYVEFIVGGTRRMRELLLDLLSYIQIAAKPDDKPEPADLNVVLDKVRENLRVAIEESQATITAAPLPLVGVHEAHMVSLFQNLIGNSIKYRSEQPPAIQVTVTDIGDLYQFCVGDNGIGIAPEYHTSVFVAFKRLHGREIPGTGIGLAICQRVVQRCGGRIWVESEPGQGANFRFTLPKAQAAGR